MIFPSLTVIFWGSLLKISCCLQPKWIEKQHFRIWLTHVYVLLFVENNTRPPFRAFSFLCPTLKDVSTSSRNGCCVTLTQRTAVKDTVFSHVSLVLILKYTDGRARGWMGRRTKNRFSHIQRGVTSCNQSSLLRSWMSKSVRMLVALPVRVCMLKKWSSRHHGEMVWCSLVTVGLGTRIKWPWNMSSRLSRRCLLVGHYSVPWKEDPLCELISSKQLISRLKQ